MKRKMTITIDIAKIILFVLTAVLAFFDVISPWFIILFALSVASVEITFNLEDG